jgi:hypothetical protein
MGAVVSYLSRLVGVVRTVSGSPGLLRVELAYVGFNVAEWATWVSILAFAYEVGGAAATGLVALVQLVPAALVAPLAAVAGDRSRSSTAWPPWPRPRSPSPARPSTPCCRRWPAPRTS